MKNFKFLLIASLCFCLFGCSKSDEDLIEDEMIVCIFNNGDYRFTLPSDIDVKNGYSFIPGDYRIFYAEESVEVGKRSIFFKAPKSGDKFELSSNDIKTGKFDYVIRCQACYWRKFKPTGGFVKGVNTTPNRPADQQKWLIEAKVYLESSDTKEGIASDKDTINIKQYFYPNFVFN